MENDQEDHKHDKPVSDAQNERAITNPSPVAPQKATEETVSVDGVIDNIESMPPEVRKQFQAILQMSARYSGPRPNPLFEKFTEAHIDKYLDYLQRDDDNEFQLKKTNRWFYLLYAILALTAFFAGIVYLLPRDKDLLVQLITLIVILGGGIGAGYGLSKR